MDAEIHHAQIRARRQQFLIEGGQIEGWRIDLIGQLAGQGQARDQTRRIGDVALYGAHKAKGLFRQVRAGQALQQLPRLGTDHGQTLHLVGAVNKGDALGRQMFGEPAAMPGLEIA